MVLVAAICFVSAHPAHAATSVESGWWTTSPVPVGPDVGEDQLLVQGGPSEPVAYAGVSFALGPDEQPRSLRLTVAPDSATTPASTLSLCPLSAPASAAAGEPVADGPAFDCGRTTAEAAPSADGTTYEFDVSAFVPGSSLDVAVLPTQSSDRVVLSSPTVDALVVDSGPATGGSGLTPSPPSSGSSGSSGSSTGDALDAGGSAPSFDEGSSSQSLSVPTGSTLDLPGTDAPAAPEAGEAAAPQPQRSAPAPLESAPTSSSSDSGNGLAPLVFVGLAATAAALWAFAGRDPAAE